MQLVSMSQGSSFGPIGEVTICVSESHWCHRTWVSLGMEWVLYITKSVGDVLEQPGCKSLALRLRWVGERPRVLPHGLGPRDWAAQQRLVSHCLILFCRCNLSQGAAEVAGDGWVWGQSRVCRLLHLIREVLG